MVWLARQSLAQPLVTEFSKLKTKNQFRAGKARSFVARNSARFAVGLIALSVAGCGVLPTQTRVKGELPVVIGPKPRSYDTPLVSAYQCYANTLAQANAETISVAVGDVKDYTGKYSINEGNAITQGASLMVYSALGKLGNRVAIHERFDTRIGEMELAYTDRRQLGDGRRYSLKQGEEGVPWIPYFGGTIMRSRYYIVGGITEVNWDIASGGLQAGVSGIGAKGRVFAMNVGVDLRIVDTQSLVVVKTVSISKQIVGEEVGIDVFRFFGDELFDIHAGGKRQEPIQLGVRTAIEQGVLELLSAVSGVDSEPCLATSPAVSNNSDHDGAYLAKEAAVPAPQDGAAVPVAAPASAPAASSSAPAAPRRKPTQQDDDSDGGYRPNTAVKPVAAPQPKPVSTKPAAPAEVAKGGTVTVKGGTPLQNGNLGTGRNTFQVRFEFDSPMTQSEAQTVLETVAQSAKQGEAVEILLTSRDTELLAPARRLELARQRVAAVESMLSTKDLGGSKIVVTWLPDPSDPSIVRDGVGYQIVAKIQVRR